MIACVPADDGGGERCGGGELRVCSEDVVGQGADPVQERPGYPAPDHQEVVLDEQLGEQLVVTRRGGVRDRFHRQPPFPEPFGGVPVDGRRGSRLLGGEL